MFQSIENGFHRLKNTLSPIGQYLLCLIPYYFLYQFAKENILIEEDIFILMAVIATAVLSLIGDTVGFALCIVIFLCLCQKNVFLAAAAILTTLFSAGFVRKKEKVKYLFSILIMIFAGAFDHSLLVLVSVYMLTSIVLWDRSSDCSFLIPFAIVINFILYGSGGLLIPLETDTASLVLPFKEYFIHAYNSIDIQAHWNTLYELIKSQVLFYVVFLLTASFLTSFYVSLNKRIKNISSLNYVLMSNVVSGAIFLVAYGAGLISIGMVPDIRELILTYIKSFAIATVLSLFISGNFVRSNQPLGKAKVFISYSHHDIDTVKEVCEILESNNISCWYAPRNIPTGSEWASAIMDAIKEADFMLLIFTSSSNGSVQVKREIDQAISNKVSIIPLKLDSTTPSGGMEYYVSTLQWFDARHMPLESVCQKLIKKINEKHA